MVTKIPVYEYGRDEPVGYERMDDYQLDEVTAPAPMFMGLASSDSTQRYAASHFIQSYKRTACKWCGRIYIRLPEDGLCRSCGGAIV